MRVMDGDLIVLTCLRMPTLILPTFMKMYYDPDAQGQYASQFPTRGQGFMQPRGDIRTSIMPRDFHVLPTDVREVVDQYFHREELERRADLDEEEYMSTNTEAAETVQWLQLHCPTALASLQLPDHRSRITTMTRTTGSSISMRNIPNLQNGWCSGRLPDGAMPPYHCGGCLTLASKNNHSVTSCLTCTTC